MFPKGNNYKENQNKINHLFLFKKKAVELAPKFNIRAHEVASSHEFLKETLGESAKSDKFVERLLKLLEKSIEDPSKQKTVFAILRSDYMLHQNEGEESKLQQVELNHISCSFSSLSSVVSKMHHQMVKKLEFAEYDPSRMPINQSYSSVPDSIYSAWNLYGNKHSVVLFVVQNAERNRFDQRHIEYQLSLSHGIRVLRKTLSQIFHQATLVGDNNELMMYIFF